jgi:hypothetical protein
LYKKSHLSLGTAQAGRYTERFTMHYPELLIIIVLMFSDYYLTIWGTKLRNEGHSNYFVVENYELNPIWQHDIQNQKMFNLRQVIMTIAAFCFFIYVFEYMDLNDSLKDGLIGFLLAHYGMLTGRHISNLLTYYYTKNHPNDLSGKIRQSHKYCLYNSLYQYLVAIVPLILIAVVYPKPFIIGCAVGSSFSIITHILWIRKYRKNTAKV